MGFTAYASGSVAVRVTDTMLTVFRWINLRHFFSHRLRSFLSVLGVALGVMLIVSVSVLNQSIIASFVELLDAVAGKAVIEVSAPSSSGFDERLLIDIVEVRGIRDAIPMVRGYTTLLRNDKEKKVLLLGVPPDVEKVLPDYTEEQISLLETRSQNSILLPEELAQALQIEMASSVDLLTTRGIQSFELIGLLPGTELDRVNQGNLAFMNLPVAQKALGKAGKYDSVYITLEQGFDVEATIDELRAVLGTQVIVDRPSFRGQSIQNIWRGLRDLLSIVGVLALFVGMFLVYNTMSIAALERRWEMGVLYTLGLAQKQIFGLFMIEATLIGGIGVVTGALLGVFVSGPLVAMASVFFASLYPSQAAQVHLSPSTLLIYPCIGLASSLAATYFPARKILSTSPVESLHSQPAVDTKNSLTFVLGGALTGIGIASGLGYLFLWSEILLLGLTLMALFLGATMMIPRFVSNGIRLCRKVFTALDQALGWLASDSLIKSIGRTSVTVGALMVSLAMLVSIGGVTVSFATAIKKSMGLALRADIYVESKTWRHSGSDVPLDLDFARDLQSLEGVRLVAPMRYMLCDWGNYQIIIIAYEPEKQRQTQGLPLAIGNERDCWDKLGRGDTALVSSYVVNRFGLTVGDSIDLQSPTGVHSFEIIGVVNSYSLGQGTVHINRADLEKYWQDRQVDQFGIMLEARSSVESIRDEIIRRYATDKQLVVMTGDQKQALANKLAGNFISLFDGFQVVVTLVAGLGVFNTLFISVLERTREIGILKALGMTKSQTIKMVAYEALAIGLIGGSLGIILGLSLLPFMIQAVKPVTGFSVDCVFPYKPILITALVSIFVPLLAVYYPAHKAMAIDVIQALKNE